MYDEGFLGSLYQSLQAALPIWTDAAEVDLSLLTVSENATYRLRDSVGRDLVLRVHRPDYHTTAEIESELAWILALRRAGRLDSPCPVAGRDGALLHHLPDGRRVVAFEFIDGREPTSTEDLTGWFSELGAISAWLHGQSRGWQRPAGFVRKQWTFETTIGASPFWGPWTAGLGLDDAGRQLLARTVEVIRRRVEAYGYGPERFGLIHGDLRLANLLVSGDRLSIIDFDDCGFCWFAYEFAASISFIEHHPDVPALQAAWMDGYRRVAPLAAEDEAMIPVFIMLRRILLVAWIASHAETPTARELGVSYTLDTLMLAERFLSRPES